MRDVLTRANPANTANSRFDEYISDPAHPVPFRARPSQPIGYTPPLTWVQWLVDDQREASGRTDVLTYTTDVLTAPVHILGQPIANLVASTSGTDSDWVVKLIDVYPDEVADHPELGGYQLAVAMDIFRGRYRESFADAQSHRTRQAARLPLRPAAGESRLPARPSHHGAGAVQLVPALRPQPADLCAEYLLGQAGGLQEGHAAHLPRAGRSQRSGAAGGAVAPAPPGCPCGPPGPTGALATG